MKLLNYNQKDYPPAKYIGVLVDSYGVFYHYWFPLLSSLAIESLDTDPSLY